MPFMQSFDGLVCEDTMPSRQTSVTPLQALAMYNGHFVNEEAVHFANRLKEEAGESPASRVQLAYAIAFGREPDAADSDEKLVGLCRILFNATEFIYVG